LPGGQRPQTITSAAGDETLLEEDFSALDLFEGLRKLRPRIRLIQDVTIDQDFGSAEVNSFESGLRANVVAPLSRAFAIRLLGEVRGKVYDFHGNEGFVDTNRNPSKDPFDGLLSNRLRIEARYQMFESWALVGGAEVSSRWEAGSQWERGLQQGAFFGVAHLFREQLSIVVGLGVRSRMGRGGVTLSPAGQIGWRITPNFEIETDGLGLNVAARVNPALTLFLRGGLKSTSYRLDDRGDGLNRAVLRDRRLPIRVGGRWKISKHWRVRGLVGAVIYQKYSVYDSDGNFFDSSTSRSPAFTGHLDLEYRF